MTKYMAKHQSTRNGEKRNVINRIKAAWSVLTGSPEEEDNDRDWILRVCMKNGQTIVLASEELTYDECLDAADAALKEPFLLAVGETGERLYPQTSIDFFEILRFSSLMQEMEE